LAVAITARVYHLRRSAGSGRHDGEHGGVRGSRLVVEDCRVESCLLQQRGEHNSATK
jgi:hypothetical protein